MKVLKVVLILVVLGILVVGGAVMYGLSQLDRVAKTLIEKGATHVLDVPTTLQSADVQLAQSAFEMDGLRVANPPGFKTAHFLTLGAGGVTLDPKSVQTKRIELPTLTLTDIDVNLEKAGGKANYQQILDNMNRFEKAGGAKPSGSSGSEYTFVIRRLEIKNISAHANLIPLAGDAAKVDVIVPEIVLTDVGSGGKPLDMAQLVNLITKTVLASIISVGGSTLPTEILDGLEEGVGSLASLGDIGAQILDSRGQSIGDLKGSIDTLQGKIQNATEGLKDGADKLQKEADKIGEGIKDLLGGKNK